MSRADKILESFNPNTSYEALIKSLKNELKLLQDWIKNMKSKKVDVDDANDCARKLHTAIDELEDCMEDACNEYDMLNN